MVGNSKWEKYETPDGVPYYYCAETGETTWERPEEMKMLEPDEDYCPWNEYRSEDGRRYYFNKETKKSQWNEPEEHREWRKRREEGAKSGKSMMKQDKRPFDDSGRSDLPKFGFFKEMLREKKLGKDADYEVFCEILSRDSRFSSLVREEDKRALLDEYRRDLEREEKDAKAALAKKQRDFVESLQTSKVEPFTEYSALESRFGKEKWWKTIEKTEERLDLVDIFFFIVVEAGRREKRKERRDKMEELKRFLLDLIGNDTSSSWLSTKEKLRGNKLFEEPKPADRLTVYEGILKDVEERYRRMSRVRERETQIKESAIRQDFVHMLAELGSKGLLHSKMDWASAKDLMKKEGAVAYEKVAKTQSGSTVDVIFEEFIQTLREGLIKHRKAFKKLFKSERSTLKFTFETTLAQFLEVMNTFEEFKKIDEKWKPYLFADFMKDLERRELKKDRKSHKATVAFLRILQSNGTHIGDDATLQDIEHFVSHRSSFMYLGLEKCESLLKEYISGRKLGEHESEYAEKEEGEASDASHSSESEVEADSGRKRKRHVSGSDDGGSRKRKR